MPPAPIGVEISKGPSRVPGVSATKGFYGELLSPLGTIVTRMGRLEQPTEEWIAPEQTEHGRDTANCQ